MSTENESDLGPRIWIGILSVIAITTGIALISVQEPLLGGLGTVSAVVGTLGILRALTPNESS